MRNLCVPFSAVYAGVSQLMMFIRLGEAGPVAQWKPSSDEWQALPPCTYAKTKPSFGNESDSSDEDAGMYGGYGGFGYGMDNDEDDEEEESGRTGTNAVSLPDGRLVLLGGEDPQHDGPPPSFALDAAGTRWSSFPQMKTSRSDAYGVRVARAVVFT